jgi:Tat protein secretion system quality control protein TatD with DNase activity
VVEVAKKMAELKGVTLEQVAEITSNIVAKVFNIR